MTGQSDSMMNLLKELALIKEQESASPGTHTAEDWEARRARRQQITDQIRALGETAS
jgi:hypothetical protein